MKYLLPFAFVLLQTNILLAQEIRCPDFSGTFAPKSNFNYMPRSVNGKYDFIQVGLEDRVVINQKDCQTIKYEVVRQNESVEKYELSLSETEKMEIEIASRSVHFFTERNRGYIQFQEGALAYVGPSRQQDIKLKLKENGDLQVKSIAGRLIIGIGLIPNPMASKPSKRQFDFIRLD